MTSRLYPSRPFLAASVAVFREGKVLLGQRTGGAGAGLFSLPGGMVELGERVADAALRELQEETGVAARLTGLADLVEVIIRDHDGRVRNHATITVFAGEWLSGEGATGPECAAVLWADPARLDGLPMTAGLAEVIAKAAALHAAGRSAVP